MDHQVTGGDRGVAVGPFLPGIPCIQGEVQAVVRAQEKEIRVFRVLQDGQGKTAHVFCVYNALPGLPVIPGAVHVGLKVVAAVVVGHQQGFSLVAGGGPDLRDPAPLRQALDILGHLCPGGPSIGGIVHATVVRPHPEHAALRGGGFDHQDGTVVLGPGGIHGKATAVPLFLLLRVVGGQVRGDHFPGESFVRALMHELAAEINGTVLKRVLTNGGIPVEPESGGIVRRGRADRVIIPGHPVVAAHKPLLAHRIAIPGILLVRHHVKSIPKGDFLPVGIADPLGAPDIGGAPPGTVVLHPPVDVVGELVVHAHVVELPYREVANKAPGTAPVAGDVHAAVVPVDHELSVRRVDPPGMVVRVHAVVHPVGRHQHFKAPAPVLGDVYIGKYGVNTVLILGIHKDIGVVKGPVSDVVPVVDLLPGEATVLRLVERVFLGLHQGVDDIRFAGGDRQPDAAQLPLGQAFLFGKLLPGPSPVMGHMEPGARAPGFEEPGVPFVFPHGHQQLVGIGGVHDHVGHPGFVIHEEDLLPGLSSIGCFEHPTLRVLPPGGADGTRVDGVGVCGIDKDAVDVAGLLQAHPLPGPACVQGAVDPVPPVEGVSRIAFSGAHPDHRWVGLLNGHRPDGGGCLPVENRLPFDPP